MKTLKIIVIMYTSFLFFVGCTKNEVSPKENFVSEITDKSSRQQDSLFIAKLSLEINSLAQNDKCAANNQFRFVGIGAKPCGGISRYIAYNINFPSTGASAIQEKDFLAKVEFYNQESLRYLKKNFPNLISDCSLPPPPKSVECRDGKPVLVY